MIQKRTTLTKPLSTGDINQDATIVPNQKPVNDYGMKKKTVKKKHLPNLKNFSPAVPRATKLKPMVEPTILCVPDIGSFMNVATNSQRALLANAAKQPSISSFSAPWYSSTSRIPFRIVSDTL
jgi:hypothetical protein